MILGNLTLKEAFSKADNILTTAAKGIAEIITVTGYVNIDLTVEIPGGHSSMPSKETAIDVLNKAIVKIRENQMPGRIPPTIIEIFITT